MLRVDVNDIVSTKDNVEKTSCKFTISSFSAEIPISEIVSSSPRNSWVLLSSLSPISHNEDAQPPHKMISSPTNLLADISGHEDSISSGSLVIEIALSDQVGSIFVPPDQCSHLKDQLPIRLGIRLVDVSLSFSIALCTPNSVQCVAGPPPTQDPPMYSLEAWSLQIPNPKLPVSRSKLFTNMVIKAGDTSITVPLTDRVTFCPDVFALPFTGPLILHLEATLDIPSTTSQPIPIATITIPPGGLASRPAFTLPVHVTLPPRPLTTELLAFVDAARAAYTAGSTTLLRSSYREGILPALSAPDLIGPFIKPRDKALRKAETNRQRAYKRLVSQLKAGKLAGDHKALRQKDVYDKICRGHEQLPSSISFLMTLLPPAYASGPPTASLAPR